jgi:hypothetical protein
MDAMTFGFVRSGASLEEVKAGLEDLWTAVRAFLAPEDSKALGKIHVGTVVPGRNEVPWAHTNDGEERVNLTLELKPGELELNLVGWKQGQSEALKNWLQSVRGERIVEGLDGYEVIAFARTAHKKTPDSRPWWQDESVRELGRCDAASYRASWITRQIVGLGSSKDEKPAFHIRRMWVLDDRALDEGFVREIAGEVERLLVILSEIWTEPS